MPDRQVPHDLNAEKAVLGALLLSARARDDATALGLEAGHFLPPSHQHISDGIRAVAATGAEVDVITVADELRRAGLLDQIGGIAALHELQNITPPISNIARYARIVIEHADHRALILAGSDIVAAGYAGRPDRAADAVLRVQQLITATVGGHGFVAVSTMDSARIVWAWNGYVPLGELTLLAGMEKAGKSLLCCELTARATRGQLDGDLHGVPVAALYLTREDRVRHVIKPRLDLAGADLDLVMVEPVEDDRPVTVGRIVAAFAEGVRFVVLDPLALFLDGLDDERGDLNVRAAMAPIILAAQEHEVAIVGLKHLNKSEGRAVLNRVSGSRAYTAAVRSVMMVADDPDSTDGDRLLFAMGNLAPASGGRRFRIIPQLVDLDDGTSQEHVHIVWRGDSPVHLSDALARTDHPDDERPGGKAERFLLDVLGDGEVPARQIRSEAADEGIATNTLKRAKERLGVISRRDGHEGRWYWRLPDARARDPRSEQEALLTNGPLAPRVGPLPSRAADDAATELLLDAFPGAELEDPT